jgi:hypothetical protein
VGLFAGDQRFEALHREREVRAALVARQRVNFVDDDRAHRGHASARGLVSGEVEVQRLGRGDENVRRLLHHLRAFARGRVARAHHHANLGQVDAGLFRAGLQLGERLEQVLLHVVAERLERRHVQHVRLVGELAVGGETEELVEAGEEGGERLARARRRGDEHVFARANERPPANLRLGGFAERLLKPRAHDGVERLQRVSKCRKRRANRSAKAARHPGPSELFMRAVLLSVLFAVACGPASAEVITSVDSETSARALGIEGCAGAPADLDFMTAAVINEPSLPGGAFVALAPGQARPGQPLTLVVGERVGAPVRVLARMTSNGWGQQTDLPLADWCDVPNGLRYHGATLGAWAAGTVLEVAVRLDAQDGSHNQRWLNNGGRNYRVEVRAPTALGWVGDTHLRISEQTIPADLVPGGQALEVYTQTWPMGAAEHVTLHWANANYSKMGSATFGFDLERAGPNANKHAVEGGDTRPASHSRPAAQVLGERNRLARQDAV